MTTHLPGTAASSTDSPDLARWRAEFPILADSVYMISNSLGAMPRGAREALAEYAEVWATRGVRAWDELWWELPSLMGDSVGEIIGAPPGSVCMQENVTTAEMTVLSSLQPTPKRNQIVTTEMDFPSLLYLYEAQRSAGFEVRRVPGEDDLTVRTERILDAIDETHRKRHIGIMTQLDRDRPVLDFVRADGHRRAVGEVKHFVGQNRHGDPDRRGQPKQNQAFLTHRSPSGSEPQLRP